MRLVYVMDPVDRVLPDKDTTFAFLRAAQRMGHTSFHCEPRDLSIVGGEVFARVRPITVSDTPPHTTFGAYERVSLAEVDAVFIRKDPPFDNMYLMTTLMLEHVRGRTLLVNDPGGLREANEKLYTLYFSKWMPRTIVSSHAEEIHAFANEVGTAVIKPLDLAGGAGVLLLKRGDKNIRSIVELLTDEGRRFAMVQEFLPAVEKGDKRVLVLDGKILGAINRVPRGDDIRSNIHAGGSVEPYEVTDAEQAIVDDIAPRLLKDGLYFVGLDIIGGKLTEVNVTSPTGIQQLSRHRGRDVAEDVIAWVAARAAAKHG